jgi:hypothetical protein
MKTITNSQLKEFAKEISKRWKFINYHCYYNCIDTKTGEESNRGGDKNFAYYNFRNAVQSMYLKSIGEDYSYFDWQKYGVAHQNKVESYCFKINAGIIELLCGFEPYYKNKNWQPIPESN